MTKGAAVTSKPSKHRQQEVLDAAARMFHEKGYEATSIQDIAEEVGILKGSLYYYIETKEDLLFGVIKQAYDAALSLIESLEGREGGALELIEALAHGHAEVFATTFVQSSVFFREFRALSRERQDTIREAGDVYNRFLVSQIRRGQRSGEIASEINPRLAAIGIIGMMNSMAFWYRPDGPATAAQIGREFARLAVGGLRK
ncbi:MAG: TetR/AcrR family transcriptional regulator [bacterium]|nr:TetR/AcrR family transcriptional regulator [bacterium]MDE0668660.1 TetR/AcrR family transcriptional regulator [bacterium]MXZ31741.1 TetR/AcrR family transcriptional regulator [Acidimicrobiia bacterium]MYB24195.1 TetR/AcrR family transcriptional regulator [Acidimicrobiia bacterium]